MISIKFAMNSRGVSPRIKVDTDEIRLILNSRVLGNDIDEGKVADKARAQVKNIW
jgi:hypothetical protein